MIWELSLWGEVKRVIQEHSRVAEDVILLPFFDLNRGFPYMNQFSSA